MLLRAENIRASYNGDFSLKNVCLDIGFEEIVAIFGPNGSGKTTLLKALYGILDVHGGRVFFNGENISNLPTWRFAEKGIVLFPQRKKLFSNLSVSDNLRIMLKSVEINNRNIKSLIDEAISFFPKLKGKEKIPAYQLSGGEQQMVALSRVFVSKPKLLILDEPSVGLSPDWIIELFRKIKEINEMGVSIILVEQNIEKAIEIAHRCYIMNLGAVSWQGPVEKLDDKILSRIFLGDER